MIADSEVAESGSTTNADPADAGGKRPYRRALWRLLILPPVGVLLGLGIAALLVWQKAPTYVSTGTLLQRVKIRFPGDLKSEDVACDRSQYVRELIASERIKDFALQLLNNRPGYTVPLGRDEEPLPVKITLIASPANPVCQLLAETSDATYAQSYLDAVMTACTDLLRPESAHLPSPEMFTQRVWMERNLMREQSKLAELQRSNNLPLMQARVAAATDGLRHLTAQLTELELESSAAQPGTMTAQSLQTKIATAKNLIRTFEDTLVEFHERARTEDQLKQELERSLSRYHRFTNTVENVGSDGIGLTRLAIVQGATKAERTYKPEQRVFKTAGGMGLSAGLGMALLIGGNRAIRRLRMDGPELRQMRHVT